MDEKQATEIIRIKTPEEIEAENLDLSKQGKEYLALAESLVITTQEEADQVGAFVEGCRKLLKSIDATWDKEISLAHQLHRELLGKKKLFASPIQKAKRIGAQKGMEWDEKERARRAEEERKEREAIEEALKQQKLEKAAKLEDEGRVKEAEEELQKAEDLTIPESAPIFKHRTPQKTAGIRTRTIQKAVVVNGPQFMAWVSNRPNWQSYVTINQAYLNNLAREAKRNGTKLEIPGIETREEKTAS